MQYCGFEGIDLIEQDEVSIDFYLDEAKRNYPFLSEADIARQIGVAPQTLNHWKKKRSLPKEHPMIKLAEMAGQDPVIAVQQLHLMRAETPEAREATLTTLSILYRLREIQDYGGDIKRFYETAKKGAAALCLAAFLGTQPTPAQAGAFHVISIDIHYDMATKFHARCDETPVLRNG